ncbi:MAG: DUF4401 domain-containing protein [Zoogloeaceae bacterium]|nr:DUF4401 domain-containing protein [Zoogloeaceae bacterium]
MMFHTDPIDRNALAAALAEKLHAAGHLRVPAWPPPAVKDAPVSRWILALQVVGGWLAALFLLGFLGTSAMLALRSATGWIIVGLLLSAGPAPFLMRTENTVLRQFLFVAALAGQGALFWGVSRLSDHGVLFDGMAFFLLALYEAVLLVWVAWMPHRLVAALAGCGAFAGSLVMAFPDVFLLLGGDWWAGVYWLAAGLLWLREPRWRASRHADAMTALAWALTLHSLVYALSRSFAYFVMKDIGFSFTLFLLPAGSAALAVLLARSLPRDGRNLAAVALLLVALALTWQAPVVGMGGVALALGFARGRLALMWIGGAVLVYGVSRFYYDLQLPLLDKSGLMALGGGLLLAVRALFGREERG